MSITTLRRPPLPSRVLRKPKHPFMLSQKPWQLQPFLCAPVLPGETLMNALMQTRVVTDPILNPLAGWWLEYWMFYVKLQDLDARDALKTMIIDPDNADVSALLLTADEPWSYSGEGGIPWAKLCLKRVVEEYFRAEGEAWDVAAIDSVPLVAIGEDKSNVWQSLIMADDLIALDPALTVGVDDSFTMSELEAKRREYEMLKMMGMARDMTWEDYLGDSGVNQGAIIEPHRPELVYYERHWSYPTNTIDPTNGTPRSAVSWATADRVKKNRFFSEPGFLLGVCAARPKVFLRGQVSSAAGLMQTSASWMPPMLMEDGWSSMVTHVTTSGSGPLPGITDAQGYTFDMRDLLLYGEQFANFALAAATGKNLVDLPTATGLKEYVDEDDINSMFVSGTADQIRSDGIVHLEIKGRQRDFTPAVGQAIA